MLREAVEGSSKNVAFVHAFKRRAGVCQYPAGARSQACQVKGAVWTGDREMRRWPSPSKNGEKFRAKQCRVVQQRGGAVSKRALQTGCGSGAVKGLSQCFHIRAPFFFF